MLKKPKKPNPTKTKQTRTIDDIYSYKATKEEVPGMSSLQAKVVTSQSVETSSHTQGLLPLLGMGLFRDSKLAKDSHGSTSTFLRILKLVKYQ